LLRPTRDGLGHANTRETIMYAIPTAREQSADKAFMQLQSSNLTDAQFRVFLYRVPF
jgi:hypothetical protein